MPSHSYSFLDVVILEEVRERFSAGEALVILSTDLEEVIWANGSGAALLGYGDIEAALGASAGFGSAAKRQISGLRGFPAIGRDRPLLARLAIGVTSRSVALLASEISLPDGEPAILLASPSVTEIQQESVIGGFGEAGHFVALIDAQGLVKAATSGFNGLGISIESLSGLLARSGESRIIKRMVGSANGPLPAGLARLTDEPTLYLLLVVDESGIAGAVSGASDRSEAPLESDDQEATETKLPQDPDDLEPTFGALPAANALPSHAKTEIEPASNVEAAPTPQVAHDTWYFGSGKLAPSAWEATANGFSGEAAVSQPELDDALSSDNDDNDRTADDIGDPEPAPEMWAGDPLPASSPVEAAALDHVAAQTEVAPVMLETPAHAIDRQSAPIRFVWRTDAEGKFSQISPEFVVAVSAELAEIVGRRFEDLAAELGFDANGDIAGLLGRRDTWSGRSVLWPVARRGVSIPVDLAALPVYGRDRDFQGFRGFGVARIGDAVAPHPVPEPDKAVPESAQTPAALPQDEVDPLTPVDPFRGETPALQIAPMPDRRSSDKIIRLAEHRQPANDKGLSTGERMAFQQIAERLKRESAAADKPANDAGAQTANVDARPGNGSAADREVIENARDAASAAVDNVDAPAAIAADPDTVGLDPAASVADGAGKKATAPLTEDPESTTEPADVKSNPGAGKRSRPGMSLLDFAHRDRVDEPKDGGGLGEAAGDPALATGETEIPMVGSEASGEASKTHGIPGEAAGSIANDNADAEPKPSLDSSAESPSLFVEATASTNSSANQTREHGSDTAILEKLPVPVLVHSGDELHYANDEFLALTGYGSIGQLSEAGGIGVLFAEPYEDDTHPERRDRKMRLITATAEEFPVEAFLQSVPWHGGKALLLVLRRVDEGRTAASGQSPLIAELEARVAEMRTIIDTATDGVVLMTSDGTIRSISRPAEALFSFDSDEVAGKAFESLFAIESQRAARDYLDGLSDNGVASVLNDGREVIGRESRGRFIPLFMTIGKLPNDSGYCAVVRDITQWKRAEEDLTQARAVAERASSQKTDFLARVSHEIRTPLNAIIGFSELMIDERFGAVTNDRYRDYLRDINRSGNHVLDLVNDLLDISKIEAGQQEMDYEAVSLNDALAETVAMMQPQANRERVIIRSSFASKLPDVVADLRSVRQIALNILSNAVRYTQAGGQVIVSTAYEAAGDIVMRVRDTGIGMTMAEIEQAMKPFKQINSLKRARGDGTGLGLPLTKAMVEANRAKFVIHSTPGEGTLVEVTFPSTRVLAD